MNTKSKTIFLVAGALTIGIIFGWLIFGSSATEEHAHTEAQAAEYTCSMHPQIRQNEPGKCPLWWTVASPAPHGNFGESLPVVHRWPYEYSPEGADGDFATQDVPADKVPVTA